MLVLQLPLSMWVSRPLSDEGPTDDMEDLLDRASTVTDEVGHS